uniref:M23 family metallopeptidase n=1 Tax=Pedobacter sp. TaxID=1411316 RepID=UPI003D7F1D15
MFKTYTLLILFTCFSSLVNAQQIFSNFKYPLVNFRQPLDIRPPALSGSFGEIRRNHFHSGLDYRTNQREGYPVYAVEDGYVSRARVQNSGFGQAVYIDHPSGYTSVYGHLQRFSPKIANYIEGLQYAKQTFELDAFPEPTVLPVHKGDIIGYSGNRGSSGGPHLHFEIRDTKTEAALNPQLLGLKVADNIPPVITSMYVYRLNHEPFDEFIPKQYFQLSGGAGVYKLKNATLINLSGEVGFGITVNDRHNGASGNNGVYSIQLEFDGKVVFTSALERFKFENSNAINSHIDYPSYVKSGAIIQKSFVDPGNPLQIYYNLVSRGRINITDNALHDVKYTVTDASGNHTTLTFKVQGNPGATTPVRTKPAGMIFPYQQQNEFSKKDLKVVIPKGSLYNDLFFTYEEKPKPATNAYSAIHVVLNNLTPLHSSFELWIKADSALLPFKDKAVIVNTNRASQGGYFEDGYVKAKP